MMTGRESSLRWVLALPLTILASVNGFAQHPGGVEIDRVYLFQVMSKPSEPGGLTVRLSNSSSVQAGDQLSISVSGLDGNLLYSEEKAPAGDFTDFTIPSGLPEGGHLLQIELGNGSDLYDSEERVYSVVNNVADDIRYGFYTLFGGVGGDYTEKTNLLVDTYINAIEYYDWFPAHGDYTPDSNIYTQPPFGTTIYLQDIQQKMAEARLKRISNVAYIAAYAGVPDIVNGIADSHLTNEAGNWIVFYEGNVGPDIDLGGVWFYLTAFAPDTPWRTHLWQELTTATDANGTVSFDGFEIDTYGWNEPYYSPNSSFNGTPMPEMLANLTGDVRDLVQSIKPNGLTTLNTISEVGIELIYDKADFLFVENWDFHKPRLEDVAMMVFSRHAASGKRFVSKSYPADMTPAQTSFPPQNLRYLMGAHLAGGGSFMVAGEPKEDTGQIRALNSLYYPDAQPQSAENFQIIRNYNAHDASLYMRNHGPGVQPRATDLSLPGTLATSFRGGDNAMTWCLLHLGSAEEWTTTAPTPAALTGETVTLTLPNGLKPDQVLYGTPDDSSSVYPRSIPFVESERQVTVDLPSLEYYGSIIVEPQPLPRRLADSAAENSYVDAWEEGSGGGYGWNTGWTFSGTTENANVYIGDATRNGDDTANGDGDINIGRRAWGLYSGGSGLVDAVREFPALVPGEAIRIHMDSGWVQPGGAVGFGLHNSEGDRMMEFFLRGGESSYILSDKSGELLTGIDFTDEGQDIEVALEPGGRFSIRIVPIGLESQAVSFDGELMESANGQSIERLRLFSFNAGPGRRYDVFFNDISVYTLDQPNAREQLWLIY